VTQWEAFALVVLAVLAVVLALARATQSASSGGSERRRTRRSAAQLREDAEAQLRDAAEAQPHESGDPQDPDAAEIDGERDAASADGSAIDRAPRRPERSGRGARRNDADLQSLSTGALLANVAVTHGALGAILLVAAWAAAVPATALGIDAAANVGWPALGVGLGLGVALYAGNELLAANLDRVGIEYSEELRDALGPDSIAGWLVLLAVVLPIIAVFEELLFRAALIGALSAGFGVSPWVLAAASSLAFGFGHGIQGPSGMIVTGLLGGVLAAAFVLTGSLLTVIVAHYLINALEFVVHEGFGIEWVG